MRPRESLPCPGASAPLTAAQAAARLGFRDPETIIRLIKLNLLAGGRGPQGKWRVSRESVESFIPRLAELRKPAATFQALEKRLTELEILSIERENRHKHELERLIRRMEQLEKRQLRTPEILAAA